MQLIFLKEGTDKMENYILIHPTSAVGICGSIWQVIRAMYHYPNEKFYVLLGNDCLFYDSNVEDTKGYHRVDCNELNFLVIIAKTEKLLTILLTCLFHLQNREL